MSTIRFSVMPLWRNLEKLIVSDRNRSIGKRSQRLSKHGLTHISFHPTFFLAFHTSESPRCLLAALLLVSSRKRKPRECLRSGGRAIFQRAKVSILRDREGSCCANG